MGESHQGQGCCYLCYLGHAPLSDLGPYESWYLHLLKPGQNARGVGSFLIQEQGTQLRVSPGLLIRCCCKPQDQTLS